MAARETGKAPEKAMDGLLRQTLQHAQPPSGPCPGPEILAAYFERSLDDRETAEYELHLSRCALCREQQAAMARAYTPARLDDRDKARWAWLWDWRWLAPATAVLVVAVVWYARRPEMTAGKSAELPYLAMSRSTEAPSAALSGNQPAPTTPPSDALQKTAPQESGFPAPTAQSLSENQAQALAARKAANELGGNLETDALKKDSNATPSDASGRVDASAPEQPAPAPARLSSTASQAEVASPANAPAPVKAEPKATPLLASRNAKLAAADRRSIETLVRTPNPQVLWRLGAAGLVERSTDGGANWLGQIPSLEAQLTAGSAPAEKICWLAGRDGVILLTTDASAWKVIPSPAKTDFAGVVAEDAFEATVTTTDGRKFTTKDGGANWIPAP
jgi:hypothetical protein